MRVDRKDLGWMSVTGAAVLFLLNIFVQINFRRQAAVYEGEYSPADSKKNDKALNLPPANTNPIVEDKGSAPLHFELRGTVIGYPSLAFIYNSDTNKHAVYKLNDFISGYKILNIRPARVTLGKDGALRELLLSGRSPENAPDEQPPIFADAGGAKVISRSGFAGFLPQVNSLLKKIKILPITDNVSRKLLGFRVEGVPEGSIIEGAGIKSGDIIHSVDGKHLESLQDAMHMLGVIRKQSGFEITLLRQDRPVILRYEFRN